VGQVRASAVSPDLKWLALSETSRGGVWNLETGQAVLQPRGFRGGYIAGSKLYADFPKHEPTKTERTIGILDLPSGSVTGENKIGDTIAAQYGPVLMRLKINGKARDFSFAPADLELHDAGTDALLWSKHFIHETPQLFGAAGDGTLVAMWPAGARAVRDESDSVPELQRELSGVKDKDSTFLLEVYDLHSGAMKGHVMVDTGKGSFKIRTVSTVGNWVIVGDNANRLLVYSLNDHASVQRLFGSKAVGSANSGLLAFENTAGNVEVYDIASMSKRAAYELPSKLAAMHFSPDGRRLLLVTSDQTAYLLDLAAGSSQANAKAN
jgi:hypothetical protein